MAEVSIGIFLFALFYAIIRYGLTQDLSYLYYGLYVLFTSTYLTYEHLYISMTPEKQKALAEFWLHLVGQEPLLFVSYVFYYYFLLHFLSLDLNSFVREVIRLSAHTILLFLVVDLLLIIFYPPLSGIFEIIAIISIVCISLLSLFYIWRLNTLLSRLVITGTYLYLLGSVVGYVDANTTVFPNPGALAFGPYRSTSIGFILELLFFTLGLGYRDRMVQLAHESASREREMYEMRSHFYTSVSHEVRTPLTLIKGLTNELDGLTQFKGKINQYCDDILRLVNNMIELSKMDANMTENNLTRLELISFLRILIDGFSHHAMEKGIHIKLVSTYKRLTILVDEEKLKIVLNNLILNAIKYSGDQGNLITITVDQDEEDLHLTVEDNGSGIDEEDLPHVFKRYYRGKHRTSKESGSGIGLAIVSDFISIMNGRIDVKSSEHHGCKFTIQLPLLFPDTESDSLAIEGSHPSISSAEIMVETKEWQDDVSKNGISIAVIEDNADLGNYLIRLLQKQNYAARWAKDGQEGIDLCRTWIPDIIITDVMMPSVDGYDLCSAMKSDVLTDHIPIIMITAKVTLEDKITGVEHGADVYLHKPFKADELFVHINQLIKQRERIQRHYAASIISSADETTPQNEQPTEITHPFLQKIDKLIDKHLTDPSFGVEKLSNDMFVDRTVLYRKLKSITGYTPSKLIQEKRMAYAAKLLQSSDENIGQIALKSGYNSQSYFSKVFADTYNCSPSQYRNK